MSVYGDWNVLVKVRQIGSKNWQTEIKKHKKCARISASFVRQICRVTAVVANRFAAIMPRRPTSQEVHENGGFALEQ
jgi:hypothetical protein